MRIVKRRAKSATILKYEEQVSVADGCLYRFIAVPFSLSLIY